MLEVRLLGKFAVNLDGRPIEIPWHPAQLLLAYLILNAKTAHRREKLAGLLWPDSDEANARNNLRQTLWRLRQMLGEDYILADKISVEFNPEADYQLDVDLLLANGAETSAAEALIQMVSGYAGPLLPGFYEDWVVLEQERLQAVFEHKMQLLLNRLVEGRRWSDVLAWGERWIALGQTPEPAYRALMLAHSGLGDRSNVVAVYQRCVKALQQELGVEPSEQTRKLYDRLLSPEASSSEPFSALAGLSGQAIGPYRLVEKIGAGGMAEVYKAYQPRLDRYVAVKFIKPELMTSGDSRARFEREAKIMAQLNHPNIVHVYDFGEAGHHYYLVMEHVAGGTLKDWLGKARQAGQVMNLDQIVTLVREIGAALDYAHQQGIIHRDIKPSNIMLTPDGRALLADFGLAKLADASSDLTTTGSTTGTPAYMSPEQVDGNLDKMGTASDLYSLGVVLYELVTGQLPFTADSPIALMFKHVNEAAPSPRRLNPDLSEVVEQVLLKVLAKEPVQRYQRAGELTEAFAAALVSGTMPTLRPSVTTNPPPMKLPLQATPFIGREEELSRLATLLADPSVKLVTLLGPGGMGKTRLAIEAARAQVEAFADGVYFVSLASIDDPGFITSQIADVLNLSFYVREQREHWEYDTQIAQLLAHLQEKQLLLILDNSEHLLTNALPSLPKWEKSVDALVAEILRVAPEVKILATSRERLNLHGETLLPLDGLSLPERKAAEKDVLTLDNATPFAAVNLFREVARRVQPDFELTPDNLVDVIDICRLVEGMPLGVELAAAWVELLAPAEIAAEIRASLDFLETTLRDIPDRQQSIRSVFETSWQRLPKTEQEVFQQLSIFRGGFTREAAQTVTAASLRTLMALVNKSLLRPDFKGRYQLHELLRQFGAERLAQDPIVETALRERHCAYFAAFLQHKEADLRRQKQGQVLADIEIELDNVRTAWHWAVTQGKLEEIEKAMESLCEYHRIRGRIDEAYKFFDPAALALGWQGIGAREDVPDNATMFNEMMQLLDAPPAGEANGTERQKLLGKVLARYNRFY